MIWRRRPAKRVLFYKRPERLFFKTYHRLGQPLCRGPHCYSSHGWIAAPQGVISIQPHGKPLPEGFWPWREEESL
jgi:hypothetical protein